MNIVLTGFMASGKTEISKSIASVSKYKRVDTDDMIEKAAGMTINEIFAKYGEERFREMEREAVKEAASMENTVIATGGGVVLDASNVEELRKTGVIFNLAPDFEVIADRIETAAATRPLLKNQSMDDIKERFIKRQPFYDNCDHKIHIMNGRSPKSYAMEILNIMSEKE